MRAAVEQVIQTASKVCAGELTAREAFTILVTLTREAVAAARELRKNDPDRAAAYRDLLLAIGRELRRSEVDSDEARWVHAVTDDLAKVLRGLE